MPLKSDERRAMDDRVCEDVAREAWSDDFSRSLSQLRRGADELIKDQRDKWQSAEAVLLRQIVDLRETIAREEARGDAMRDGLAENRLRLEEETRLLNEIMQQARSREEMAAAALARLDEERRAYQESFAKQNGELEFARRELAVALEDLAKRRETLAAESASLDQRMAEATAKHVAAQVKCDEQKTAWQELENEQKRLQELRSDLEHDKAALERERDLLQIRQRETAAQRRRLAREFRLQRMQLLAEVHQGASGSQSEANTSSGIDEDQVRLLREEIAVRSKQQETLEQQLLDLRESLAVSTAEEKRLRASLDEARAAAGSEKVDQATLAELRQQLEHQQLALQHANSERKSLQTSLFSEREQAAQMESRRAREQETLEHELQHLREQLQRGVMDAENELVESRMAVAQAKVEQDRAQQQLSAIRKQLDAKIAEIATLKCQTPIESNNDAHFAELEELKEERDALLAELEQWKSKPPPCEVIDHSQEVEDLRHRIDMSMADLRQANAQIAELKKQLAQKNGGSAAADSGGAGDWEHQKRMLLAQLEADECSTPQQKKERLKIEDVIARTSNAIADKDAEIAELKALLEMRPAGGAAGAESAFGAAAISQLLDSDELVKQQRESLERMTQELQEKLRQCEIDTSLERAKLARERAELQEQLQKMSEERSKSQDGASKPNEAAKAPGRRNWLDHLGINKGPDGGK